MLTSSFANTKLDNTEIHCDYIRAEEMHIYVKCYISIVMVIHFLRFVNLWGRYAFHSNTGKYNVGSWWVKNILHSDKIVVSIYFLMVNSLCDTL